jgi:hypothetical protein
LLEDELTGRLHGEIEMMQLILSALAGAIGGASIAGLGMIYSAAVGGGFWSLPNSIGGIVLGPEAGDTRSLGLVTLVGMAFHIALSVLYGGAIVYLAQRDGLGYVITGISVGILIWLFNHLFVGTLLPGAKKHTEFNPLWLAISLHALYGAIAGAVAAALI